MERKPYRVAVWGPGGIGKCLVREILAKPELELVGVLAYNPEKNGADIGEWFGYGRAGVKMTTNKEDIFNLQPDCVLHCPQATAPTGIDSEVTNDICRILGSGINVVTSVPYHYPPTLGSKFVEKIESACKEGKSAIHASGINPGLLCERWVVGLTSVCTSIDSIKVQEISDTSTIHSTDMLRACGYGLRLEEAPKVPDDPYYNMTIAHTCKILGLTLDLIEVEAEYYLAEKQYDFREIDIGPGMTAGRTHRFIGIVNGKPFFILEEIFYMDPKLCPVDVEGNAYFATAAIEAKPTSVYVKLALKASVLEDRLLMSDGTRPTYNATAVSLIQAIPLVCGAKPGIVYPYTFTHSVPDLRDFRSPLIERAQA